MPLTVTAGDQISASVQTDGQGLFTLTISVDGSPFSTMFKLRHASLSSAEVITEAPSSNHGPFGTLGLTDFGSVSFSGATVDGQAIGAYNPDQIEAHDGTRKATTSTLGSDDASFSVTWNHS